MFRLFNIRARYILEMSKQIIQKDWRYADELLGTFQLEFQIEIQASESTETIPTGSSAAENPIRSNPVRYFPDIFQIFPDIFEPTFQTTTP